MNVLIGCELSGRVANAFALRGHNVYSCDLEPNESFNNHYQGDIFTMPEIDKPDFFDLAIIFPPCTFLCRAQSHLLSDPERYKKHLQAIDFVKKLWSLPIKRIAIENPIGALSTEFMKPHQLTSFHEYGDPYKKDICLWLKNLPPLKPTNIVPPTKKLSNHVNSRMTQEEKSKIKSRFFYGISTAMAEQWG